jgi:glycosyltransferase
MKKQHLYIFSRITRASFYGIGTYLDQLICSLENEKNLELTLVELYSNSGEVDIIRDKYRRISIPTGLHEQNDKNKKSYYRNVSYLLNEFIDKNQENIFHLNYMQDKSLASSLRQLYVSKIVLTCHYTDWSFEILGNTSHLREIIRKKGITDRSIIWKIEEDKKIINNCDKVICIAQHSFDSFTRIIGLNPEKFKIIPNSLKDNRKILSGQEKKEYKRNLYLDEGSIIILFAGRLDEIKGISCLINAFEKLLQTHTNVHLFIAGSGSFDQWIPDTLKFCTKVSFVGKLDKESLYEFYAVADIGVVPSIHEEFGFVAIEMMMHSLPVIVGDTSGLSEIVDDHVTGLKVTVVENEHRKRSLDIDMLSDKIRLLIENPGLSRMFGENGRKKFLEKYELKLFRENMLNFYSELFQKVN